MTTWLILVGMTVITFANRFAFFPRSMRFQPSVKMRRFLSFSSHAILTSIWAPILFQYSTHSGLQIAGADYLIAASLAAVLCLFKFRSILVVLISTASFFLLRFYVFA